MVYYSDKNVHQFSSSKVIILVGRNMFSLTHCITFFMFNCTLSMKLFTIYYINWLHALYTTF